MVRVGRVQAENGRTAAGCQAEDLSLLGDIGMSGDLVDMNGRFGAATAPEFSPPSRGRPNLRRPRSRALVASFVAIASLAATSPGTGLERSRERFIWPVAGKIIVHPCGDPREAGVVGLDLILPPDAEIRAAEKGVVAFAGDQLKRYGHLIVIRHSHGWASVYAHTGPIGVKRGDRVERGEAIATAPSVDSPDRAPFHFELRLHARPVDRAPVPTAVAHRRSAACAD